MKKQPGNVRDMEGYIASIEQRQRNLTPPDFLRNGRTVDEALFKGSRDAPLVQRIGIVVIAVFYVVIGLSFVSLAIEQHKAFEAAFAVLIFTLAAWFIRNALLRRKIKHS